MKKFAIFFCILTIAAITAGSCQAVEYGQIGGRPANPDPKVPDSSSWFIYGLEAGKSTEDAVEVVNLFEEAWDARVYAADSVKSAGGGFAVRQESEPKLQVGAWVRFYPDAKPEYAKGVFEKYAKINEACAVGEEVLKGEFGLSEENYGDFEKWCQGKELVELTLAGGERKIVPFVFSVPESAEIGEHTGGIIIQKVNKDEVQQQNGSRVLLTTRVGVRIYETVPGEILKGLDFSNFAIKKNYNEFFLPWDKERKAKFSEYVITTDVINSGNVSTDFSEKIFFRNLLTRKDEIVDGRDFQVLRGDTFVSSLAWKAPRFAYMSIQKEYKYVKVDGNEQVVTSPAITKWFLPWREIVITLLFLVLVCGVYALWRHYQKKRYGGVGWVGYEIEEGDTVAKLAKRCGVDWKVLAKTNKLKAPYLLEEGMTILVPNAAENPEEIQATIGEKMSTKSAKKDVPIVENPLVQSVPADSSVYVNEKRNWKKILVVIVGVLVVIALVFAGYFALSAKKTMEISAPETIANLDKNISTAPEQVSAAKEEEEAADEEISPQKDENSEAAKPEGESEKTQIKKETDKSELAVSVLNGGAIPGSAGKVKDMLFGMGYEKAVSRNAEKDDYAGVAVYYGQGLEQEAQGIAKKLEMWYPGTSIEAAGSGEQQGADIVVILGK